ncbi:uncharacterized protein C8A04DRAFT_12718 [Dichotomopilus funicola]|uniref:HNH endonuclease n=1 Tax=Dichotomopilus funicola TaxID=1934379 RepID=A0AAN6V254_9PEZI|nr:hypothetical protein C8A04DRAFT_12718 [Dichotomopilus funicola]
MADEISDELVTNYEHFRDALSSFLVEHIAVPFTKRKHPEPKSEPEPTLTPATTIPTDEETSPEPDPDDLADFTTYLATATFLALPPTLQSIAHHTWTDPSLSLQTQYSLPLTPDHTLTILQALDPSVPDSLVAYGLATPAETPTTTTTPSTWNLPTPAEFLAPILTAYLTTATSPPPPPRSTKATAMSTTGCEICGRDWLNLGYHHLIPRMVHAKVVKRGWHRPDELQNVAWLCGACHRFVHRFRGHEELAREFYTVERLLAAEEVRRFAEWVGRVRWKAR